VFVEFGIAEVVKDPVEVICMAAKPVDAAQRKASRARGCGYAIPVDDGIYVIMVREMRKQELAVVGNP
jgi:hypothetical protein